MTASRQCRAGAAVLAALLAAPPAAGADDAQAWLALAATTKLSDRVDLVLDTNTRLYDNASHYGHFQVRGLIGWKPSDTGMLGVGYSYVWSRDVGAEPVREHRIFQQANYRFLKLGKAELVGRTRLEQRFFSDESGVSVRVRQQVRLNVPLKGPDGLKGIVYTEGLAMLSTPAEDRGEGINQFRSFAGLGIPLTDTLSMEAGYLNQSIVKGADRMNHILSLGLGAKF